MVMDLQLQLCAFLHAAPGALVGWLHTLANTLATELQWPATLIAGPHTFTASAPTPFETLALYLVDGRVAHDIPARQVALAITYLPLRHPGIGLDLRVWPLFPAALETLKYHFSDYFTQASPVLSSAAALHFACDVPSLACNRWLLDQLEKPDYADPKAAKELYPAWLEQYRALRGDYPVDPRRGFRALLARHRRRHTQNKDSRQLPLF
jgi:hypothetical protein